MELISRSKNFLSRITGRPLRNIEQNLGKLLKPNVKNDDRARTSNLEFPQNHASVAKALKLFA